MLEESQKGLIPWLHGMIAEKVKVDIAGTNFS